MARSKLPRNVKPGPSDDPADKLHACMSYRVGRGSKRDADYLKAPLYYDACWDWHEHLSGDQQDCVTYVLAEAVTLLLADKPEDGERIH
jgi:hypothetical protein